MVNAGFKALALFAKLDIKETSCGVTEGGSAVAGLRSRLLLSSSCIRVLIHKRLFYPTTESRRNSGRLFWFILEQHFKLDCS